MDLPLDRRPIVIAIAGPNGAGKTTFYNAHLSDAGLRYVNADVLSRELRIAPYAAADLADSLRRELLRQRESFVFETVFSDPAGYKLSLLKEAADAGYTVVLCFIGLSSADACQQRVAMRVSQGGHDVPDDKLKSRYPRVLANLRAAIRQLPHVWIFDNDDLLAPFRLVAVYENSRQVRLHRPIPKWFAAMNPKTI